MSDHRRRCRFFVQGYGQQCVVRGPHKYHRFKSGSVLIERDGYSYISLIYRLTYPPVSAGGVQDDG